MWLASVRDVGIILLAVESLVIGALLAVLMLQLRRLVKLLEEEIKPVLDSASETVNTVRGATDIVSETLVSPLIRMNSYVTGIRTALATLIGIKGDLQGTPEEPVPEGEAEESVSN